ncbi:MAG TPA: glycosyltransferase [Pseudonocardia sp.]|jgi:MGT family glycosyltransferase|uniref:glycosyltransferase n=1 Tax=Pseudonocardia sp. TaxID=60912 RepID=UPI002ED823AC
MRVLFTLIPATGSLHPLVPLARALVIAGHEVRFACAASFAPTVGMHGFDTHPVGIDFLFSSPDYFPTLVAEAGVEMPDLAQLRGHARHAWVTNNLFVRAAARRMLPDVLALARSWKPDLIVRESSEYSGCVAAEALGIPHASVAAAADAALDLREVTAAALEPLRAAAGLAPDPSATMVYRYLHLSFMPAEFFGPDARFPATIRFLRHVDPPRPGDPVPDWWARLPDQPTVLASLGTIFFRTPGLYEAIVAGLGRERLNLAVAVGHPQHGLAACPATSADALAGAPNVHIEPTLPIPELLGGCALFVTHGGFNSVKEAARAGTPMLVIPIASDQHYSADRAEALGIARVVRPHERTPRRIREQALAVLANPTHRHRAAALAAQMAALPDMGQGVTMLEQLDERRRERAAARPNPDHHSWVESRQQDTHEPNEIHAPPTSQTGA